MWLIILPVVAIFITTECNAVIKLPNARYLGLGYNVIYGNPDSSFNDPGFLLRVLAFTWNAHHTTSDRRYEIPDHIQVLPINSCGYQSQSAEITGSTSYQDSMSIDVSLNVDIKLGKKAPKGGGKKKGGPWGARFTAGVGWGKGKGKTEGEAVIYTDVRAKCVTYEVAVNYLYAPIEVTDEFKRAVDTLPTLDDNKTTMVAYGRFITTYGTHFTSRVMMGAKMLVRSEFKKTVVETMKKNGINFNFGAQLAAQQRAKVGASYENKQEKKARQTVESARSSYTEYYHGSHPPTDGKWESWTQSSADSPAPLAYTLVPITNIVSRKFLPGMSNDDLRNRSQLLHKALSRYCDAIPGCKVPKPDPVTVDLTNATCTFRRSPTILSCRPNYKLLSCGIKNMQSTSSSHCDTKRYAIPLLNNKCECYDNNGAICMSWCSAVELQNFTIQTSIMSDKTSYISCPAEYEVHTKLTLQVVLLFTFYPAMLAQSAIMRLHVVRPSVRLSVTFRYRVQIDWNSSKIISRPNGLRSMCWPTPNMGDLVQREHPQNWG